MSFKRSARKKGEERDQRPEYSRPTLSAILLAKGKKKKKSGKITDAVIPVPAYFRNPEARKKGEKAYRQ